MAAIEFTDYAIRKVGSTVNTKVQIASSIKTGRVEEIVLPLSCPPSGGCKLVNIWYDPDDRELKFTYDDTEVA